MVSLCVGDVTLLRITFCFTVFGVFTYLTLSENALLALHLLYKVQRCQLSLVFKYAALSSGHD